MRRFHVDREGMTLIELLVAVVVAALILQGAVSYLIGQSRLIGQTESQRVGREMSRAAVNVFLAELRRVETGDDRIVQATESVFEARVPFALGIVCGGTSPGTTVSLLPLDSVRLATAAVNGYAGFAVRNEGGGYGSFVPAEDKLIDPPSIPCGSAGVSMPLGTGFARLLKPAVSPAVMGTIVLLYDRIRYEFVEEDDGLFLYRALNDGEPEALVGPFDPETTRFRYYAAGNAVAQDAAPSPLNHLRGVELVLQGLGDRPQAGSGAPVSVPLTASVFFKNSA